MKYLVLIYDDGQMLAALSQTETDGMMAECRAYAEQLRESGHLLDSRMLAPPAAATIVRIRHGRISAIDGPFTETKEILGGFNLIEATDLNDAIRLACGIPWARTGCVEVRPLLERTASA